MLEKPDLPDEKIIACLQAAYGLRIAEICFLPVGADLNTAVYRGVAEDEAPYFVKLRKGDFDEIAVTLPQFLHQQGVRQIIAPLPTRAGQLWAELDGFKLILYPFVEGKDVYQAPLPDRQWVEFGEVMRQIHSLRLPAALARRIPRESYPSRWRDSVRRCMEHLEDIAYPDPIAIQAGAFLREKRPAILDLVERAEWYALELQGRSVELVLCHSDLHAGNLLVTAGGELFIVDWDNPIFAPKERDLMYAGGAQFAAWRTPSEEERLFYQGYGPVQVDMAALAYYRCERIVTDIAIYCEQLLLTNEGGDDRAQALKYLRSNFDPGGTIEAAYRGDKTGDSPQSSQRALSF